MNRTNTLAAAAAVVGMLSAATASAQIVEPDTSHARMRIGPLLMNPTIELTNLGVDTNVYNEPAADAKQDFTISLTPRSDLWLKAGRTWLVGTVREDVIWYKTYANQRAANTALSVSWLAPLNRLGFDVTAGRLRAKDRPGFEIDTRVPHTDTTFKAGVEYRALSKTYIGVRGDLYTTDFDKDAEFLGANLGEELSRTMKGVTALVRHQLTPLTSIAVDAGLLEDRFKNSELRDSNSATVGVQVTLDPAALIKGTARFGYRKFEPVVSTVPGYEGTTVAVDLTYALLGTTRFTVLAGRDVAYSYDVDQPYYLQTGVSGTVAQQIFGPLDVVGRGGIQHLNYRDRIGGDVAVANRLDTITWYGGGLGYHVGQDLRIGINVDHQQRTSELSSRQYEGFKFGTAVTYGF